MVSTQAVQKACFATPDFVPLWGRFVPIRNQQQKAGSLGFWIGFSALFSNSADDDDDERFSSWNFHFRAIGSKFCLDAERLVGGSIR